MDFAMKEHSSTRRDFVATSTLGTLGSISAKEATASENANQRIHIRKVLETDVLVCGGGCAGTAAILAYARVTVIAMAMGQVAWLVAR